MILSERKKIKRKEKNRVQKEKRRLKQCTSRLNADELECGLEKLLEYIVAKKLTVKLNRDNLGEIINSFVGKQIRFFQILDQVLKRYLDVHCISFRKSSKTSGKTSRKMTNI